MRACPLDDLAAELQRLDVLLHREILRLRARYQLSLDEFRGLYISDEQVNSLIDRSLNNESDQSTVDDLTERAEALREAHASERPADAPWRGLVEEFHLTPIEQDLILLALAPELDVKYETLYAYFNNDITRKWPTFDLALRLLSTDATQSLAVRRLMLPESTLFASGILNPIHTTPQRPSWLAAGFTAAPGLANYVLGLPYRDPRLATCVEACEVSTSWETMPLAEDNRALLRRVSAFFSQPGSGENVPLLIFEGRQGAGRRQTAEAFCREVGRSLFRLDLEAARASAEPLAKILHAVGLQQRLCQSGVYLDHCEALFDKEGKPLPEAYGLTKHLAHGKGLIVLACEPGTKWKELVKGVRVVHVAFTDPDYTTRLQLWHDALGEERIGIPEADVKALADRFVLNPGQIKEVVTAAREAHALDQELSTQPLNSGTLFSAARMQSDQSLGTLAQKVKTIHLWDDLILPRTILQRVKEVAEAVTYRHVVYTEWGFERRIASGKGLKVLFAGASGTGKTMTAGVIAKELGLDLYKIDLSSVVSKYIGETEKNLDRIFRAAHCSNAILFFDEADALFGKRSEVKDAHDRYANIEVAYLLQKLEEHEGVVILASNISKNIDDAFSRRMHYVVEFPLPDEQHREHLWRGMFPPEVPLSSDIDFPFLAKQFPLAGGDIKNVALDAAFLAAQDGRVVTMKQLIKAMAKQVMKQGKIPSSSDFKQYQVLIAQGE